MKPKTQGIHHLGLTVSDVKKITKIFIEIFDWKVVGGNEEYPAIFLSDGTTMYTFWEQKEKGSNFDRRKNLGLHHFALKVENIEELQKLFNLIKKREDIKIEFGPQDLRDKFIHTIFQIPNELRLELICEK